MAHKHKITDRLHSDRKATPQSRELLFVEADRCVRTGAEETEDPCQALLLVVRNDTGGSQVGYDLAPPSLVERALVLIPRPCKLLPCNGCRKGLQANPRVG